MLLSFSIPTMRPMIHAGLMQRRGYDVGGARVKRQTIRKLGARGRVLLEHARGAGWTIPYDLHLWWKSRTPERELIGVASYETATHPIYAYPINILHSTVQPTHSTEYPVVRIDGPRGWRSGDSMLFWSKGDGDNAFVSEARADGFDNAEAFRDYFVPNIGDRFDGVLFKW